jgi:hypothetical protein
MTVYTLLNKRNNNRNNLLNDITNEYNLDDIFFLLTMHINYYYDEIYFTEPIMQFFENSENLLKKLIIENPHLTRRQLGSAFLAFNIMMIISLAGKI